MWFFGGIDLRWHCERRYDRRNAAALVIFAPHGGGSCEAVDETDGDSSNNPKLLTTIGTLEQLELRRLHTMRHTYREMMRRRKRWVRRGSHKI